MSIWLATIISDRTEIRLSAHIRHSPRTVYKISENVVIISVPFLNRSSNPIAGRFMAFSVDFLLQAVCRPTLYNWRVTHFVVVVCKLPPSSTFLTVTSMKLPACELIPRVSKFCHEEWQDIWNSAASNKLHAIYPVVGTLCHNKFTSRREAVIINRLI